MTPESERETVAGTRLCDDAYMIWAAAENDCEEALRAWFAAGAHNRAEAYSAYCAALDREEAAARDLQVLSCSTPLIRPDVVPGHDVATVRERGNP
jgi:hypothetical protein